jgi:hypothetical protein
MEWNTGEKVYCILGCGDKKSQYINTDVSEGFVAFIFRTEAEAAPIV